MQRGQRPPFSSAPPPRGETPRTIPTGFRNSSTPATAAIPRERAREAVSEEDEGGLVENLKTAETVEVPTTVSPSDDESDYALLRELRGRQDRGDMRPHSRDWAQQVAPVRDRSAADCRAHGSLV